MAPTKAVLMVQQKNGKPSPNLHTSLKPVILFANCLGLFPVNGVTSNTVDGVYFSWTSPKMLFSLIILVIVSAKFILDFPIFLQKGLAHPSSMVSVLLSLIWMMEIVAYIYLARKWPQFIRKWLEVEESMRKTYNYQTKLLDRRIKIKFLVYVVFSTAVYVLLNLDYIPEDGNYRTFFANHFPNHAKDNFSLFYAISHQTVHMIRLYALTFNDIFVVIIGSALALQFKCLAERLKKYGLSATTMTFWSEIRRDYTRLSSLCYLANEHISLLIFLSFTSNFQTILFKMFQSIDLYKRNVHINFLSYILFTVVKILGTSAYTAWVNDASKESVLVLNRVPAATYNSEVKILLLQISFDDVALTGLTLFRCTKGLLISIAGALVTYELVLVQFNTLVSLK